MKFFALFAAIGVLAVASAEAADNKPRLQTLGERVFPSLTAIYRFTGVADNAGGDFTGFTTVFHCTNSTPQRQTVRFTFWDYNNAILAQPSYNFGPLRTYSIATKDVISFQLDAVVSISSNINQGAVYIAATNGNIHCTAQIIDAAASTPLGVSLNGARLNSVIGIQE